MKFKLSSRVHLYSLIFWILSTAAVTSAGLYFWKHTLNADNADIIAESKNNIDKINNVFEKIKVNISEGKAKEAMAQWNESEVIMKKMDSEERLKSFDTLFEQFESYKLELGRLSNMSNFQSLASLLQDKTHTFESYSLSKNWVNLSKMARKLNNDLTANVNNEKKTQLKKMYSQLRISSQEVSEMQSYAISSTLGQQDKNVIMTKLNAIQDDLTQLTKYLEVAESFEFKTKKITPLFQSWFTAITPKLVGRNNDYKIDGRVVYLSVISFLCLSILGLALGITISSSTSKRNQEIVEKMILNAVKDGVISSKSKTDWSYSQGFYEQLQKYHDHVHKRMGLGNIFQETLPFGTLILDSNLNVMWANDEFYESWKLQEYRGKGSLSWDYLVRFTDIDDSSIFTYAMNQNVSGIYEMKMTSNVDSEPMPFHMYVRPMDHNGSTRIMLMFYPYFETQEKIDNLATNIKAPLFQFVDAFVSNTLTTEKMRAIQEGLSNVECGDIFDKLNKQNEMYKHERAGFINAIETFETNINELEAKNVAGLQTAHELETRFQSAFKEFVELKNDFSKNIQNKEKVNSSFNEVSNLMTDYHRFFTEYKADANKIHSALGESVRTFRSLVGVKSKYREEKNKMVDLRMSINNMLDQLLVYHKTGDLTFDKIDLAFTKLKNEIRSLDKMFFDLDKVLTDLDIALSKFQIIDQEYTESDLAKFNNVQNQLADNIKQAFIHIDSNKEERERIELESLSHLKKLYSEIITARKINQDTFENTNKNESKIRSSDRAPEIS